MSARAFYASPVVHKDRVYIGNGNGYFYALDAATGQTVWQYPAPSAPALTSHYQSNPSSFGIASSATIATINGHDAVIFGAPDRSVGTGWFDVMTFSPWAGYAIPNGIWLTGDFNGDGRADVFHGVQNTNYAHIWMSTGPGTFAVATFSPWQGYAIPNGVWLTGDFNGDRKTDLFHAVQGTDYAHVWLSSGNGTFQVSTFRPWQGYAIPNGIWMAGDFNGDGRTDVFHAVAGADYAHVWTSTGGGSFAVSTFQPWQGYAIPNGVWLTGDFNGDGRADVFHGVAGAGYAHVWTSTGPGNFAVSTFRPWAGYAIPNGVWLTGDFNGDGKTDVFHGVAGGGYAHVWSSTTTGAFSVSTFRPWNGYAIPNGVWLTGDFNRDGRTDVLHAVAGSDYAHQWTSRGNGQFRVSTFRPWVGYAIPNGVWLTGDFSGDRRTDVFHAVAGTNYAHIWIANGGFGSGRLFALDAATGAEIWKSPELARLTGTTLTSTTEFHEQIGYSSPLVHNGRVYIGIADHGDNPIQNGRVEAVSLATGARVPGFGFTSTGTRGGGVWTTPATDGSGVYVTTGNTRCWNGGCQPEPTPNHGLSLLRLAAATGGLVWKLQPVPFALDDDPDWAAGATVMSTTCGTLVASVQKDGWAYAVAAGSTSPGAPALRWQFPSTGVPFAPISGVSHGDTHYKKPGAAWGDVLFIVTGGLSRVANGPESGYGKLHALNACAPGSQRVRWILDVPGSSGGGYSLGPPTVSGGIVYIGTDFGRVVAIADPSVVTPPSSARRCEHTSLPVFFCSFLGFRVVPIPVVLANVQVNGGMWTEPALAKGRVFVSTSTGYVHMLAP